MTKLTGLNTAAFAFLFIFAATILCVSCKKEDDVMKTPEVPAEPLIEQVDVLVLNRATGLGIPDMKVELWKQGLFSGDLISSKKTNGAGEVQFTQFSGEINGTSIRLSGPTSDYQSLCWVNGELDSSLFKDKLDVHLNSIAPQEFTIELYPITRFNILASNVAPSAVTDTIKLTVKNIKTTGGFWGGPGIKTFEFAGLQSNAMIEGEVKIENILSIDYEVVTETGTEQFSKTVTCEPGGLT